MIQIQRREWHEEEGENGRIGKRKKSKVASIVQRNVKMGFCVYALNVIGKREERDIAKSI